MKLSALRKGGSARITALPDGDIRAQCIRIGLMEGAVVSCLERLPGGTIILQHSRQELAMSIDLADGIIIGAV